MTKELLPLHCDHDVPVTKRCEKCEMDAMLDRGTGFTPPRELPPSKKLTNERLAELIDDRRRYVAFIESGDHPDLAEALEMGRDMLAALQQLQRAENEPPAALPEDEQAARRAIFHEWNYQPSRPEGYEKWLETQVLKLRRAAQPPGDDATRLNWWFMNVLHVGGDEDDDEAGSDIEYEARLCRTPDEFRAMIDAAMGRTPTKEGGQ